MTSELKAADGVETNESRAVATTEESAQGPANDVESADATANDSTAENGAPDSSSTAASDRADVDDQNTAALPTDDASTESSPQQRPSDRIKIGGKGPVQERPKAKPNVSSNIEAVGEQTRKKFPPPNIREQLSPELQKELDEALGDQSLDDLVDQTSPQAASIDLAPQSRVTGKVVSHRNDDVFLELGGRNQGIASRTLFDEIPNVGDTVELVVNRFNREDGLYECSRPNAAMEVGNWEEVNEGDIIEVTVTKTNKGGLECKVAGIRGFIPMGQASLYHIDNPEELIDQRLTCLVTEANPRRKNLVLSRKAVMEREKAEAREKLLAELEVGQIREGIVRNMLDFGAFVDLGGVDGLIHIRQLSWDHIKHPSEVLEKDQKVKVRIEKIDQETGKIGLAYRELAPNPWDDVESKYPVGSTVTGTVAKVMDFGAFLKLESGVEGLVHISELAHGRVWRTSDAVSEGQELTVKILSVDTQKQRIGLSLKALMAAPVKESDGDKGDAQFELPPDAPKAPKKQQQNLKGGIGGQSGGEKFGLKW